MLLDLPVATGLARARGRTGSPDRFETEQTEFFERVRAAYLQRAARHAERFRVIDATLPAEQVAAAAVAAIGPLWPAAVAQ